MNEQELIKKLENNHHNYEVFYECMNHIGNFIDNSMNNGEDIKDHAKLMNLVVEETEYFFSQLVYVCKIISNVPEFAGAYGNYRQDLGVEETYIMLAEVKKYLMACELENQLELLKGDLEGLLEEDE